MKKSLFILLTATFAACDSPKPEITASISGTVEVAEALPADVPHLFGIPLDTLETRDGKIKPGQTISQILFAEGFEQNEVNSWIQQSEGVLNLRNIRAGSHYTVFCSRGPNGKPVCMVYEESRTGYVVFDGRSDKPRLYREEKEVQTDTLTAAGSIRHSLYQTVVDLGYDQALCLQMAEILRWSVDFFALNPGDKFRAIYTARTVEGDPIGIDKILALEFIHGGKTMTAFRYERDGKIGYYDIEGKSMKSRFLQAPLEYSRISSRFSKNRFHPILKRNKPHLGTDYAAPHGTPIVSVADGIVVEVGYKGGNGNYVKIKHDEVYTTQYLHMSRFGTGIRKGVRVSQGQVIGYVGSTGLATGPHLCYRFWKHGKQVDPFLETPQATEPLHASEMPGFIAVRDLLAPQLAQIRYHEAALFASANILREMAK